MKSAVAKKKMSFRLASLQCAVQHRDHYVDAQTALASAVAEKGRLKYSEPSMSIKQLRVKRQRRAAGEVERTQPPIPRVSDKSSKRAITPPFFTKRKHRRGEKFLFPLRPFSRRCVLDLDPARI